MAQLNDFAKIYTGGKEMAKIQHSGKELWSNSILPYVYKDGEKSLYISNGWKGGASIVDANGVIKSTIKARYDGTWSTFQDDVIKNYSKVEIRFSLNKSVNLPSSPTASPRIGVYTSGTDGTKNINDIHIVSSLKDNIIYTQSSKLFYSEHNAIRIELIDGAVNSYPYSVNIHSIKLIP